MASRCIRGAAEMASRCIRGDAEMLPLAARRFEHVSSVVRSLSGLSCSSSSDSLRRELAAAVSRQHLPRRVRDVSQVRVRRAGRLGAPPLLRPELWPAERRLARGASEGEGRTPHALEVRAVSPPGARGDRRGVRVDRHRAALHLRPRLPRATPQLGAQPHPHRRQAHSAFPQPSRSPSPGVGRVPRPRDGAPARRARRRPRPSPGAPRLSPLPTHCL